MSPIDAAMPASIDVGPPDPGDGGPPVSVVDATGPPIDVAPPDPNDGGPPVPVSDASGRPPIDVGPPDPRPSDGGSSGDAGTPGGPPALDQRLRTVIQDHGLTGDPARNLEQPSPALVDLGRLLFFDKILSGPQTVSCASCHHPRAGLGDDLRLGRGVGAAGVGAERRGGFILPRHTPSVWNAALLPVQFWDGRIAARDPSNPRGGIDTPEGRKTDLASAAAAQSMFPPTVAEEMGGEVFRGQDSATIRRSLAQRIADIPAYAALFQQAFGDPAVTPERIANAIGAYEVSLVHVDTPWFRYVRTGNLAGLSESAKRGALVFYEKARCQRCHTGDLGTDLDFHNIGMPQLGFGLGNGDDLGRALITGRAEDDHKFRTPPLVNVALTDPYGHDGAYGTLAGVVRHHLDVRSALENYANDGGTLDTAEVPVRTDTDALLATLDPAVATPTLLNEDEFADLLEFLRAQTDPAAAQAADPVPDSVPSGLPVDR